MIPVTDLRIGNYVHRPLSGICQIAGVSPATVYINSSTRLFNGVGIESINAIPLTEEWLKEFGFIGDVWLHKTFPDSSELGTITKISYNNGIVFIKQKLLQGMTQSEAARIIINHEDKFGPIQDDDKFGIPMLNNTVQIERRINHVHTLQNLYYALTGEELKRKEE